MSEITTTTTAENTPATTKVSIKETVLAQFKEAEATITTLATKYKDVAYAVATPSGMREAIAARADLRDNGRLFVTKAEGRIKTEVNDLKRVMADEVERLVAIVKPVEDAVDAQIKAEEKRKADDKAAKDKIEADRVAVHRGNIDRIKGYVAGAEGKPLETIVRGVEVLSAITFGPEWEEFATEASDACLATIVSLNKLAESERQRLENERLQKELADARALLAAAAPTPKAEAPSQDFVDLLPDAEPAPAPVVTPTPAPANLTHTQVVQQMPATVRQAMAPTTKPTLRVGEVANRLGFGITAAFLSTLGFEAAGKEGASVLYHEADFIHMCIALQTHVGKVAAAAQRREPVAA